MGLVRAFLVAGAARVLASLWPVDDAVTAVFMDHFYAALQRGLSPAQALGDAQTAVACRHPHPAFWAGFVLFGGW
jgi:CHAT domain-containing protein